MHCLTGPEITTLPIHTERFSLFTTKEFLADIRNERANVASPVSRLPIQLSVKGVNRAILDRRVKLASELSTPRVGPLGA